MQHRRITIASLLGAAAMLLSAVAPVASSAAETLPSTWQRGMNFTSWSADGYGSDAARGGLRDLAALGTDRIVLTPTWYMDTAHADTVAPDPVKTPSDASLATVMREAHALRMQVVLKPHVDVRDGTFRGAIAPADRAAWFDSYGAMLGHYADIARRQEAQTLVVGTELTSMASDTDRWDTLIARARAQFAGTLTYAANWVDGAEQVAFWDRLDVVGIDAYMPLSAGAGRPTVARLAAAWAPHVERIANLHARTGKPVMFTELGYQSRVDTLDHPAAATGSPDPRLQAVAYEAALRVWRSVPWFQGISWWNWEAEPTGEDPAGSFSIAGKPAAAVLRAAQGGTAVDPGIERSGATVPPGAGVLLLLLLAGLTAVVFARRGRPSGSQVPTTGQAGSAGPAGGGLFAPSCAHPIGPALHMNLLETLPDLGRPDTHPALLVPRSGSQIPRTPGGTERNPAPAGASRHAGGRTAGRRGIAL